MITATSESLRLTPLTDNLADVLILVLPLSPKSEANFELGSASSSMDSEISSSSSKSNTARSGGLLRLCTHSKRSTTSLPNRRGNSFSGGHDLGSLSMPLTGHRNQSESRDRTGCPLLRWSSRVWQVLEIVGRYRPTLPSPRNQSPRIEA
jgi:hypothetical protein